LDNTSPEFSNVTLSVKNLNLVDPIKFSFESTEDISNNLEIKVSNEDFN